MIKKFASRGMEAFYCATSADAVKKVRKLIPEGSSVTWGGSATLSETGILDALQKGPYGCIDRSSAKTPEEARALTAAFLELLPWLLASPARVKSSPSMV